MAWDPMAGHKEKPQPSTCSIKENISQTQISKQLIHPKLTLFGDER
jgi:hypothetical protein